MKFTITINETGNTPKVGDFIRVVKPRTAGGRTFDGKVVDVRSGGNFQIEVQTGPLAGSKEVGKFVMFLDEKR